MGRVVLEQDQYELKKWIYFLKVAVEFVFIDTKNTIYFLINQPPEFFFFFDKQSILIFSMI